MTKRKTSFTISDEAVEQAERLAEAERRQTGNRASRSSVVERLIRQAALAAAAPSARAGDNHER